MDIKKIPGTAGLHRNEPDGPYFWALGDGESTMWIGKKEFERTFGTKPQTFQEWLPEYTAGLQSVCDFLRMELVVITDTGDEVCSLRPERPLPVQTDEEKACHDRYREKARDKWESDEISFDGGDIAVSESDEGAFVAAWVWIDKDGETEEDE